MDTSGSSRNNGGVIVTKERTMRLENPFSVKVGQVFTGFGIGCGIGIGVGRPINLAAIPMLNQVMGAARGATDAFSGVGRHVNSSLRKFGAKNIEAGIGCGVGFGHGFGVGLAIKPGVVHQLQSCLMQTMANVIERLGMSPSLPAIQGVFPGGLSMGNEPSISSPVGTIASIAKKAPCNMPDGSHGEGTAILSHETVASRISPSASTYSSRTEKVVGTFLESSLLKEEEKEVNGLAEQLRSENNLLQMVLRHQRVIEELMEENKKLHKILVEDLKISPDRLQDTFSSSIDSKSPCTECFDCRRRRRRRAS
ncbi:OLC1v1031653C3 [Oldenlandia corymbosa var. corymbosa]|uniref:OLC1v1031653C3 n=2 Tax=Oldenlandia corymbosa var. corymbosa TaxID=529605 RepID=A0AAV1CKW9_OLDCO|nr:OLC1v1031653C3 [Oldenlandia corymbosa var. corymbosa]